jgi:hypothetical protein
VKNLKIGILVCGVLGILSMFIPQSGMSLFQLFKLMGGAQVGIMIAAFALPTVMGAMALKAPMQKWQAGVAAAGFGLASFKLEVWKAIPHIGDLVKFFPMLLIVLAAIAGLVLSIVVLVKGSE